MVESIQIYDPKLRVDAETTRATAAETALATSLNAEGSTRATAITTLTTAVNGKTTSAQVDTAIANAKTQEASAGEAADEALGTVYLSPRRFTSAYNGRVKTAFLRDLLANTAITTNGALFDTIGVGRKVFATGLVTLDRGDLADDLTIGVPIADNPDMLADTTIDDKAVTPKKWDYAFKQRTTGFARTVLADPTNISRTGFRDLIAAAAAIDLDPLISGARHYPGYARALFSSVTTGLAKDRPPLTVGTVVADPQFGWALRIDGSEIPSTPGYIDVALRQDVPLIQADRKALRWVVRRTGEPVDPAGEGLELRADFLDRNGASLGTQAFGGTYDPHVDDVPIDSTVVVSRAAGFDVDTVVAQATRSVTPFVRVYGSTGSVAISLISAKDYTSLPVDYGDVGDALAAIEASQGVILANLETALEYVQQVGTLLALYEAHVTSLGSMAGPVTIDLSLGKYFYGTATDDFEVRLINDDAGREALVSILQDEAGGHSIGFSPESFSTNLAVQPLTPNPGAIDLLRITTLPDGAIATVDLAISPFGSAANADTGRSVAMPGASTSLEALLTILGPVTGTSKTYGASDLFAITQRSNGGVAMMDTLPGAGTFGLQDGSWLGSSNLDTVNGTLFAPAGFTVNGGASVTIIGGTMVLFSLKGTDWRPLFGGLSQTSGAVETFTPTLTLNGTTLPLTGTVKQVGRVSRDGKKAYVTVFIQGTINRGSTTGTLYVNGLPAALNVADLNCGLGCDAYYTNPVQAWPPSSTQMRGSIAPGATRASLVGMSATGNTNVGAANLASTNIDITIALSGSYLI